MTITLTFIQVYLVTTNTITKEEYIKSEAKRLSVTTEKLKEYVERIADESNSPTDYIMEIMMRGKGEIAICDCGNPDCKRPFFKVKK